MTPAPPGKRAFRSRVKELVCGRTLSHPDVLREPPPPVFCIGFGVSGLTCDFRVWTNRFERSDAIRSELAEAVSAELSEAKVGHTAIGSTTGGR